MTRHSAVAIFLVGTLCSLVGTGLTQPPNVMCYLPAGAKLARVPVWTQLAPGTPEQVVVFYTYPKEKPPATFGAVAVLQRQGRPLKRLWSADCGGAEFYPDSGVYDINHTGTPKIVVDCSGTTVCPNFFGIFEYKGGRVEPIPAGFAPFHTCRAEIRALSPKRGPEIVIYAKPHDPVPEIYQWNGLRYALADSQFPLFWEEHAERYVARFRGCEHCPLHSFVEMCSKAVKMFDYAGTPQKGIAACEEARQRVATGRGIDEASWRSYPALRSQALAKIDSILLKARARQ